MKRRRRFRTAALVLLNGTAVVAIVAIVLFALYGGAGQQAPATAGTVTESVTPSVFPTITADDLAPVERMVIPAIDVDAPIIEMGVDDQNRMAVPDRPDLVAWYGFTATPGEMGNAVFAAHVNWHTGEYSVFSRLDEVVPGDEVLLTLEDGETLRYRVMSLTSVDAITTDASTVIGPTGAETITLITCHGTYDWNLAQYRERLVVRAERVP